jgi:hypothetical protein
VLSALKPLFGANGTVTAGNASGINDGAAALIIASEAAVKAHGLTPRARILGLASAGVEPRVMGVGPIPATRKLMAKLGLTIHDFDAIELNEAFASQSLAVMRALGLADDAPQVNPNGGAIALGHPLGMSGARLALTLVHQLEKTGGKRGLATLCVGVGIGLALAVEGFDNALPSLLREREGAVSAGRVGLRPAPCDDRNRQRQGHLDQRKRLVEGRRAGHADAHDRGVGQSQHHRYPPAEGRGQQQRQCHHQAGQRHHQ